MKLSMSPTILSPRYSDCLLRLCLLASYWPRRTSASYPKRKLVLSSFESLAMYPGGN